MIVYTLVHVPDAASFDACTLVFDSIRTGFPTAKIFVTVNPLPDEDCKNKLTIKLRLAKIDSFCFAEEPHHHADWITDNFRLHDKRDMGAMVVLDPDTWFHEKVEHWDFRGLIAGQHVDQMWNDYAGCVSVSRLHTAFLWLNNVLAIKAKLKALSPASFDELGHYAPLDVWSPDIKFRDGKRIFWDTAANLYHALKEEAQPFGDYEFNCYEHLHSASALENMASKVTADEAYGLRLLHREMSKNPADWKGKVWPLINSYYNRCHLKQFQH